MNKRQYPRAECCINSSYKDLDAGDHGKSYEDTVVSDISQGGIRFRVSRFIPIRNRLSVYLRPEKSASIEAVVKSAWIRELPRLSQFEIGASFISISEDDKKLVQNLLNNPNPGTGPVFGWLDRFKATGVL